MKEYLCFVLLCLLGTGTAHARAVAHPMRFGVDSDALDLAVSKGLAISYSTFWVGSWNQRLGLSYAESQLRAAASRSVTPVIQWWYWGDDITPNCLEQGCRDQRQNVFKDKANWDRMSLELAQLIERTMGTREVVVIIEAEFNKGGVETYEPFDGMLAEKIALFKRYGNIKTVVGFGNWGRSHWSRFDRAAQATDLLGVQLMRSSVREASTYLQAVDTLLEGARDLQTLFGKPTLVTDLALSSFPVSSYDARQALVVEELFSRIDELKAAGVRGVLYRRFVDDPTFDTSNYHGEAERHWGLLRADRSEKPAFAHFAAGVRREAAALPPPALPIR